MSTLKYTIRLRLNDTEIKVCDRARCQGKDFRAADGSILRRWLSPKASAAKNRADLVRRQHPDLALEGEFQAEIIEILENSRRVWPLKTRPAADKPLANPFDTSPQTEAEAIHDIQVRRVLEAMISALQSTRKSITLQQLCDMQRVRPVFEAELPEIEGRRHGIFFFSVSGELNGRKVERALLGGSAIVVSAENLAKAAEIANAGLADTLTHANQFAFAQAMGVDLTEVDQNAGIVIDAGGTRVR